MAGRPGRAAHQAVIHANVKLHALTERRLHLALKTEIPQLRILDASKVNSIFRPTLPVGDIWEIRSAW